ncbi:Uncharacterised protein [Klebsiella oxytoca]|nr:Uncharacterised protein [Klebsiella oxytoca]
MGMDGDNGFIDIGNVFVQAGYDIGEFERHGVADGIRDIDGRCAGIYRGFDDAGQIGNRRTASIFTGKLNVVSVVAGALNHIDSAFNHFIQITAQLGRDVHRRGGDKGMNTEGFRDLQRFRRNVDIFFNAAGQRANAAVFDGACDGLHGFKIARG